MKNIKSRIAILDGFRALAILSVVLYLFFTRWTFPANSISLYPYNNRYDYFKYGQYGVQFFFIISGFVILFTLENTTSFGAFWKRRFIRLFPSMLFASLITFTMVRLFDAANIFPISHNVYNLIPGLTFLSPEFLNNIFHRFGINLNYMDGSYWSLWPEIQFYFFSSTLYYINKEKFIRNFLVCSILLIVTDNFFRNILSTNRLHLTLPESLREGYYAWSLLNFNLIGYLPFFCIGAHFYLLYKNRQYENSYPLYVKICFAFLLVYTVYSGIHWDTSLIYIIMILLFFCFLFLPGGLKIFENKIITNIGESSYFLYLLYDIIGTLLIYLLAKHFLPVGFIFTLILIFMLIVFSNFFTFKIDRKIGKWLKSKL
jgi:peptidoglycan/LPS O-acetylase OafA/YrhL